MSKTLNNDIDSAPDYAGMSPNSIFTEALEKLSERRINQRTFDTLQEKIDLVKDVYLRLTREKVIDGQTLTPGFEQLTPQELQELELEEVKRTLQEHIDNYIQHQLRRGHNPPVDLTNEQKGRLAELAVEGIVRQDFDKRAELLILLDELQFSFSPKNGADRLLTFWSDDYEGYKQVLNTKLSEQGNPGIATDFDVTALDFVHQLRAGVSYIINDSNSPESVLVKAAKQGSITLAGFLSSVYAASTAELGGTVYVMSKEGIKINNFFWNVELPVLRALQKAKAIGEIKILHEPFYFYTDKPLEEIGSRLTAADVGVLANYNYLPQWLVDEEFAAMHKSWVDSKVKAHLIELHKELQIYIDNHSDSGRIPAMKELLQLTNDKLLELNAFDDLAVVERIAAAKEAPAGNKVTLWRAEELLDKASVPGKKRGESYQRILSLLSQVTNDSKPSAFRFPDASGQSPYITLKFHGDVIDSYSNQLKRLLPFHLLREAWGVVVTHDTHTGELVLNSEPGGETHITVIAAQTIEQKLEQQKQVAILERFLLANFTPKDMPALLSLEGEWIKSGEHFLAQRIAEGNGFIWRTEAASVDAVRTVTRDDSMTDPRPLKNRHVETWFQPNVEPSNDGGSSRYNAQIIIQTENDPVVSRAAAHLAGKHPNSSIIIQLAADGGMRVVYGDVNLLNRTDNGIPQVRWQIVGHGRTADDGHQTLGGLLAGEMVGVLKTFINTLVNDYGVAEQPTRISLVGCSLGRHSEQDSFGMQFTRELATAELKVSVHTSDLAVDAAGRKRTLNGDGYWVHKTSDEKLVLQWRANDEIVNHKERSESAVLVGRDEIDVAKLLEAIREGRQSPSELSAAQQYALSHFFPDEHDQLDRLGLIKNVENPYGYSELQRVIHDLGFSIISPAAAKEVNLRSALLTLDVEKWGEKFDNAIIRLLGDNHLEPHWMPIIANTEDLGEGNYRIQFINRDLPEETRWVTTNDATFIEFRHFIDERLRTISGHFVLERGQLRSQNAVGEVTSVDGLNAGFAIQALIEWVANKHQHDVAHGTASPDLAMALRVHCYLNYAQMAHGAVQDVTKIAELVRTALRGEVVVAETSLMQFSSTLAHVANEGVGVLLNGAMVGLDIYELAHAKTETQKAVFGTQLAFDSAGLITGVAGVTAGVLGASSAAAVLAGPTVILAGLAVGFAGLAKAYGAVADDAKAVGRYFDMLDTAYKGNGYRYDHKQQILVPLPGAVFQRLDLINNQIDFDSQYIYRCKPNHSGWAKHNWFFGGGTPDMIKDRGQAINVRSGIGYTGSRRFDGVESIALILPGTPKSYIRYEHQALPGATLRGDTGFDVARRLEHDERFFFDFYVLPSEYIVNRIYQEYVYTSIDIILDQQNRQLVMPALPSELHNYLHYEITGAGDAYRIVLNKGSTVKLTSLARDLTTQWIIDSSELDSDSENIHVEADLVVIGGVKVHFEPNQQGQMLIVNKQGDVRNVDFKARTAEIVSEDASRWSTSDQGFKQHLSEMVKTHKLHGQYVVVDNYHYNQRNVGRAFYDVIKERMLFSDVPQKLSQNAILGAVTEEYAYFYDSDNATAWRVDIATGRVDAQFEPWANQIDGDIRRLWQEGDVVYLTRHYWLNNGEAELSYQILEDRMELVGVSGNNVMLQHLARTRQQSDILEGLLQNYKNEGIERTQPTLTMGSRLVEPTEAALVTVLGTDVMDIVHRYWIRKSDGALIKPNLANPGYDELLPGSEEKVRSHWPIPADLMLAGSMVAADGLEVFFFYSRSKQLVFRQEGVGQAILDADHPTAFRVVNIASSTHLINVGGEVIAITAEGRVANLDANGGLHYGAVNEHWLKGRANWWQDLASVTKSDVPLAVFGVKGKDDTGLLAVWYYQGKVVVASPALQGKSLQFLGFDTDGSTARLFEPESGKLYLQSAMTHRALNAAFENGYQLVSAARLPAAWEIVPELNLKAVQQFGDGLRLITTEGVVLERSKSNVRLVGVDHEWQQGRPTKDLTDDLSALALWWNAQGVLSLFGNEYPRWFDISSGLVLSGEGIPTSDKLRFVGINANQTSAFAFTPTTQKLYKAKGGRAKSFATFKDVKRIGSSLLLQGGLDNLPMLIDGVDSLVMYGGAGNNTYRIDKAMWEYYSKIIIDNDDPAQKLDKVLLPINNPNKITMTRLKEDLLLTYSVPQTTLVIRKVFGKQANDHQHLLIEFPSHSFNVSILIEHYLVKGYAEGDVIRLGEIKMTDK
ncbi:TPA: hypothetical protein SMI57_000002 [Serratia liquefaciens]|nr:hypothetical protein [Serratia liquefaciens]